MGTSGDRPDDAANLEAPERKSIRLLGEALNESLVKISAAEKSTAIAISGIVAVLTNLPGVQSLDPKRVGAVVATLARGRPDEQEFRVKVANFAAKIITIAQELEAQSPKEDARPAGLRAAN